MFDTLFWVKQMTIINKMKVRYMLDDTDKLLQLTSCNWMQSPTGAPTPAPTPVSNIPYLWTSIYAYMCVWTYELNCACFDCRVLQQYLHQAQHLWVNVLLTNVWFCECDVWLISFWCTTRQNPTSAPTPAPTPVSRIPCNLQLYILFYYT